MMIRKKILVPVNFDNHSDATLDYAQVIARSVDGMISCLHIIDDSGYSTKKFLSTDIRKEIRREAEQKLAAQVNSIISDKTVPYEIIVTEGKVHRKIIEKASDLNAAFIVMGRSDTRDLTKNMIGSNTYYVITHARVPVITVKYDKKNTNKDIVLPLDLSKPTATKVAKTIEVAQMLKAVINVLTILNYDLVSLENAYKTKLNHIQQEFIKSGLTCNTKLIISRKSRAEEIITNANKYDAGMILLMTQQEKDITDFFVGSTARGIIQNSKLPVMSIIPEVLSKVSLLDPVLAGSKNPI